MPGKKQKAKERLDKFYELAKTMGYRSRASFKLVQLNKKYDFLSKARTLVDLCAAPGSWSQVAAKEMPAGSTIIGVDLVQIAPLKGCKFIVGDITTDKTRNDIKQLLAKKKCEVVIHDGAPNVGGTYSKDAFNQNLLTLKSLKLAAELLMPDGWFITKVFRSGDSERLVWVFKQLFEKVEQFKPAASRAQSAEVFYVCGGFKAPKKLDASLFSARTVFEMIDDDMVVEKADPTTQAVAGKKKAIGYDNLNQMSLFKKATVEQFLEAEDPKQFLNGHNQIVWDGNEDLLTHKLTNNDVKEYFKDLQLVSKWEQNKLIKWAKAINRERAGVIADARAAEKEEARLMGHVDDESEDDDEKIAGELAAMKKRQDKSKKRAEKKMIERKLQEAEKLGYNPEDHADTNQSSKDFFEFSKCDLSQVHPEINEEDYDDNADVGKTTAIAGYDIHKKDEQGRDMVMVDDEESSDEDEDEAKGRPDRTDYDFEGLNSDDEGGPKRGGDKSYTTTGDYYKSIERVLDNAWRHKEDYESDEQISSDESEISVHPEKWIDSSEEDDSSTDDDDGDSDSVAQERSAKVRRTDSRTHAGTSEDKPDATTLQQNLRSERLDKSGKKGKKKGEDNKRKGPGGFEEIPTEFKDPEVRARTLAIAQQMLESKKRKREVLEEGIHRYCFSDEGLPKWFLDEERRYNVRGLPITKQEVEEQKARFKEINARPHKKVAEAVARRRKRAADKLKRILVKEKADPRLKGTSEGLTVRKMMRSKDLRRKKKVGAQDNKSQGEERLAKKRAKLALKGGAGKKKHTRTKGAGANKASPGQAGYGKGYKRNK